MSPVDFCDLLLWPCSCLPACSGCVLVPAWFWARQAGAAFQTLLPRALLGQWWYPWCFLVLGWAGCVLKLRDYVCGCHFWVWKPISVGGMIGVLLFLPAWVLVRKGEEVECAQGSWMCLTGRIFFSNTIWESFFNCNYLQRFGKTEITWQLISVCHWVDPWCLQA